MPIDSNIYSQMQAPDIVGNYAQGMRLKQLANQTEMQNQQIKREQDARNAYNAGVVQNPDGTVSISPQKTIAAMASAGLGKEAADAQSQYTAQQKANLALDMEKRKNDMEIADRGLSGVKDQESYSQALKDMGSLGLDTHNLPQQYDPNFVARVHSMVLSAKDKFEQQNKQQEFGLKKEEIGTKHEENAIKREQLRGDKFNQANQQTVQLLESMRGNPAVQKAENDLYAGQKANTLYNKAGDPNNMNDGMFNLYKAEVAKIANGGQASVEELKGLDPNTLPQHLAKAWQSLTNSPTKANLGEFAKMYKDYTDSVQEDAKSVIKDRYGRIIESKKRSLNPEDAKTLEQQYINRFDKQDAAKTSQSGLAPHPADDAMLSWAKQNPKAPGAADVLKANGL